MRVLVVEDSRDTALLMQLMLAALGDVDVEVRIKGFETLIDDVEWETVDAVIVDQWLDRYDGKELLKWVAIAHPEIRRIMLTADAMVATAPDWADRVFVKPVTIDVLASALREKGRNG